MTMQFRWITQGGDFNTSYNSKVEILLPELDEAKSMTWNLYVGDFQGKHIYDMILGRDIFLDIKYAYASSK